MKNILLLISFTFALTLYSCSSDRDNIDVKEEWPVNKEVPAELIGTWKINHISEASDPSYDFGNFVGAFVNIKNNTVEYYDGNNTIEKKFTMPVEEVSGSTIENGGTVTFSAYYGRQKIACKKSSKYSGQVEFTIIYASDSSYKNMILTGTKQ